VIKLLFVQERSIITILACLRTRQRIGGGNGWQHAKYGISVRLRRWIFLKICRRNGQHLPSPIGRFGGESLSAGADSKWLCLPRGKQMSGAKL